MCTNLTCHLHVCVHRCYTCYVRLPGFNYATCKCTCRPQTHLVHEPSTCQSLLPARMSYGYLLYIFLLLSTAGMSAKALTH